MNDNVTDAAIEHIKNADVDFSFLYLGYTDFAGHSYGWLSDGYMEAMKNSWVNIKRVVDSLPEEYAVIITSDHGGHDRCHGTDLPEDMTIPMFFYGENFIPDTELENVSILDIAPTIANIMNIEIPREWEGKIIKNK